MNILQRFRPPIRRVRRQSLAQCSLDLRTASRTFPPKTVETVVFVRDDPRPTDSTGKRILLKSDNEKRTVKANSIGQIS